jgi:hypothetical protein
MKHAIILSFLTTLSLFAEDPWPGVKFAEVKAYAWPGDQGGEAVILEGMSLKAGVMNPDGAVLTPEQVKRLLAAVTGKHPAHAVADCHIPHNAFVFYDDAKKPVAFVEICFGCLSNRISPRPAAPVIDLVALAAIFAEHKLPMGEYPDLAAFKKHFKDLNGPAR